MEEMNLIRMTPEAAKAAASRTAGKTQRSMSVGQVMLKKEHGKLNKSGLSHVLNVSKNSEAEDEEEEDQDAFFDMLSRVQAERMNDQRCQMPEGEEKRHLVSQGSFNQQPSQHRMVGNKENKEKKSKPFPMRANSLPVPVFSSDKNKEKSNSSNHE